MFIHFKGIIKSFTRCTKDTNDCAGVEKFKQHHDKQKVVDFTSSKIGYLNNIYIKELKANELLDE